MTVVSTGRVTLECEIFDFLIGSKSPDIDPERLCPFCDSMLPEQPTPKLMRLLELALNQSYREARPSNRLGRKAPMMVFVAMCERHRFERELIPTAIVNGWPTSIDWSMVRARVVAMKGVLESIVNDRGRPIVYGGLKKEGESQKVSWGGPRMECVFWQELLKDLEASGSRRVSGLQGQFANFERAQPGYYGELGSMVIHQALYELFPDDAVDPDAVQPLGLREFIGRILVPEVGMRLVMEDMGWESDDAGKQKAIAILRASASYGTSMFPDDDSL
ncbi:RTC4-like domain-containing protein [Mycena galopus ATCC 62051]|nr:RTC4-like domain-containing protein [Mycena galopus ATCC 62051]